MPMVNDQSFICFRFFSEVNMTPRNCPFNCRWELIRIRIKSLPPIANMWTTSLKLFVHLLRYRLVFDLISLYASDGTTELDPMTPITDVSITQGKSLIVKVEPALELTVSLRRHGKSRHKKAIHSSCSFLTSTHMSWKPSTSWTRGNPIFQPRLTICCGTRNTSIQHRSHPIRNRLMSFFSKQKWKFLAGPGIAR